MPCPKCKTVLDETISFPSHNGLNLPNMKTPAKPARFKNVYKVLYSMGGVKGTGGTHYATIGEAYAEVNNLNKAGFNATVELTQVKVVEVPFQPEA